MRINIPNDEIVQHLTQTLIQSSIHVVVAVVAVVVVVVVVVANVNPQQGTSPMSKHGESSRESKAALGLAGERIAEGEKGEMSDGGVGVSARGAIKRKIRYALVVTADDMGICAARNEGIVKAMREGVVTQTSVMANGFVILKWTR